LKLKNSFKINMQQNKKIIFLKAKNMYLSLIYFQKKSHFFIPRNSFA